MDIMNFLGKCVYFNGNSVNASCFTVNSGSAHVTHTSVFFSRLSPLESILMSVFPLSSDTPRGGDNSLTFGMVVLMCLLGVGQIIWGLKF